MLRDCGVDRASTVVLYGDGGPEPYRLWWTLKTVAELETRVLDGGLQAWKTAGHHVAGGDGLQAEPGDVGMRAPVPPPAQRWPETSAFIAESDWSGSFDATRPIAGSPRPINANCLFCDLTDCTPFRMRRIRFLKKLLESRNGFICSIERQCVNCLVSRAAVIVVMTGAQREQVERRFPAAKEKVFRLGSFDPTGNGDDVADPIGLSVGAYRAVCDRIDKALPGVVSSRAWPCGSNLSFDYYPTSASARCLSCCR